MPPKAKRASVSHAVTAELDALTPTLANSPQAAMCRQLAAVMAGTTDPRLVAVVSRELRAALDDLREAVARAGKRGDAIDELGAKRAARRGSDSEVAGSAL